MTQSTPFCEVGFVEPPFTEIIGSPFGTPCPAAAAAADEPEVEVEVEVEVGTEPAPEAEAETEVPSPVMTMVCGEEASRCPSNSRCACSSCSLASRSCC